MKALIAMLLALVGLAWGWDLAQAVPATGTHPLWVARQALLTLSGFLSIALMSLTMLLATRPTWLETPLGGMDRIYRTHKWAGILAVVFAALHWLIEMSSDILKATIGRAGRVPKESFTGFLEVLRDLAGDMGEWAIYALLAMLVVTLWKRFPYRSWRVLHKAMPVIYLMLAFHAALLAPQAYWQQPAGVGLALLLATGVYGAVRSLLGSIGRSRKATGHIVAIEHPSSDVTTVRCQLDRAWRGHRPGQFAFVRFDDGEGAHPFTIASADRGDNTVSFQIKALGDYTGTLAQHLRMGQTVQVEGPYGRFELARRNPKARQIWIAGGIGVTPFLAWLESLQTHPEQAPTADLHYCTRDQQGDPFVPHLQTLCATLPTIRLHIHSARQGATLKAEALQGAQRAEIWFCGPSGLAASLQQGLRGLGMRARFHQEAFAMR
ncbi:ferric reductase-like transmembrane domain-containing protein [Rhodoferax sp. AJA081-3]|uniref:ferredoxin reductase family protein n=1 Tax=Rhodoferax sp. AJA081-3 TaxID=2752316 RepID=UPI001ADFA849|nr:ferric reductase-like transmembrane domain-containing protein [Rhodoferax sp. AJA081-3]QTN30307.1 ferric reductase-like transmembrane domain-containing protein [Rhodoferax sp. AJA081-3]